MTKEKKLREFLQKIWNEQRKDLVELYITNNYKIHLDAGDLWENKNLNYDEFRKRLDFSFGSFPDMNFEVTAAIEDENYVAVNWILRGTNLGNIGDFPPTNKKIESRGMTIYHFENDLISGHSQVFDRMTIMRQLGFI